MANIIGTSNDDILFGTAFDDWLDGLNGNDVLYAGDGNDGLSGGAGDDFLYGEAGDDNLIGGPGDDLLDGGSNGPFVDTADYNNDPSGVVVNLVTGTATDGWGGTDTLVNIESVTGSSFNDYLIGDAGNNWFRPGTGIDYVDAGGGYDVVFYENLTAGGVVIDLYAGWAQELDAGGNVLSTDTILNFEAAHGSYFDDIITLANGNNYAFGRAGDDEIYGLSGNDNLIGGSGGDTLDGGANSDWASYSDDGYDGGGAAFQGAVINLALGTAIDGWGDMDTLISIENIAGSQFGDQITGDNNANSLIGRGGNDTIIGGGGFDWLQGGSGNDSLDGGGGYDIANYKNDEYDDISITNSSIVAHLGAVSTVSDRWGNTDTLISIERVDGSDGDDVMSADSGFAGTYGAFSEFQGMAGDDAISGNGSTRISYFSSPDGIIANLSSAAFTFADPSTTTVGPNTVLDGWGGTDSIGSGINSLHATYADDYVLGSSADEEIQLRGGNDWVDGGGGVDMLRYSAPGSVHVNLADGITYNDGWGGVDTLFNIENIRGGGNADTLTGDDGNNFIRGEGGNDLLQGAGGDDDFWGGSGNDFIEGGDGINYMLGGAGDDTIIGGSGTGDYIYAGGNGEGAFDYDVASFSDATGSITATLGAVATVSGAGVGTDTLSHIEYVRGGQFGDVFTVGVSFQSSFSNKLDVEGLGGNDVITGNGETRVRFYKAEAGVTVDLALGVSYGTDGLDTANVGWDTFSGVNRAWGSLFDDVLLGSAANEEFRGDEGNDFIDGRGGTDRIDFVSYGNGVFVDLAAGVAHDGQGDIDTLVNFENITGSRNADDLNGDGGSNVIRGSGGDDVIDARTGDDEVTGDGGNDTIIDAGAVVEINGGDNGKHHGKGHDKGKGKGHDKHNHDDDGHGHDGHGHGKGHHKHKGHDDHKDKGKGHDDHKGKGKGQDKHDDGDGTIVVIESDNDIYTGGIGDDLFVFGEYNGNDTITDFSAGAGSEDVIDVSALNLGGLGDLLALADDNGGSTDTTITFSDEGTVTLIGVQVADLHQDDFII
jgi:Ca2+-binding RTX toxin-like protein